MKYYIGVDISKNRLDVDWLGEATYFKNDTPGISNLVEQLQLLAQEEKLAVVLCEASGGYEQTLVKCCRQAKLPIHVVHANRIRYFARSQGIKAKTDKIDAKMISAYGAERKPQEDTFLLSENAEKIRTFLKRREQLLADKKRETNRLDKIDDLDIKALINAHIEWLNKSIKELESILSELQKAEDVSEAIKLLTSVPGVGNLLACYLLTYLPELGQLSHKAIAALVGVAPFNQDSGQYKGKRFIQGGRSVLRQMLYMAAMTSIKWNPDLKVFYKRLRDAGKPGKKALVAVMRKLLSIINSVVIRQTPWQAVYKSS